MLQNVQGCAVHYEIEQSGRPGETPVLFLHGWGCDASIFQALTDALRGRATLITVDFPAHGQSEEPPQPWGVEEYSLQLLQVLQDNEIGRVRIIAHSFGGRIAIYLASHYPELVDKLVITGGAGLRKPTTEAAGKKTARYKQLRNLAKALAKVPLLNAPMQAAQEGLIRRYGSPDYVKLSETMRASFVKIISEDLTPLLVQITAPTLLVWGSADTETPLWMAQTMEREIPDAGLVVFEGSTHYAFLEQGARFAAIVKQFFWGGEQP